MPKISKIDKETLAGLELPVQEKPPQKIAKEAEPAVAGQKVEIQKKLEQEQKQSLEGAGEGKDNEAVSAPTPVPAAAKQSPYYPEIEKILEADLGEVYNNLSPQQQEEFKIKGEETAVQVSQLLNSAKIKFSYLAKQIFGLIINWLKIIPGVNKFFVEQEAKIKSDKILALKKKE
ncbi:hypothetical protein KJ840_00235 [Patescibacteria group bacterium]|nr:hypothetical protein [Patescibacteria group bacterium]